MTISFSDFVGNLHTIATQDRGYPSGSCLFVGSAFRHSRIKKRI